MSPYSTQQHSQYLRSPIFATNVGGGLPWIYKKVIPMKVGACFCLGGLNLQVCGMEKATSIFSFSIYI